MIAVSHLSETLKAAYDANDVEALLTLREQVTENDFWKREFSPIAEEYDARDKAEHVALYMIVTVRQRLVLAASESSEPEWLTTHVALKEEHVQKLMNGLQDVIYEWIDVPKEEDYAHYFN